MRLVSVDKITPEMTLAKAIYLEDQTLLNVGVNSLYRYKERLKNLGIEYIYVNDGISEDIEVNDVIKSKTRQDCKTVIKETMQNISFNQTIDIKKIKSAVNNIIDELLNTNGVILNLVDIKSYDSYTFDHSVNVTVLSILLGKNLNLNKKDLYKMGIGAILHDIGKMLIPEEILKKPASLTDKEYSIIKKHARLGYEYVKDYNLISPLSRAIILSHHERLDGSGYPRGLKEKDIHHFVKIVSITDVYDALSSDRIYRKRWPVHKVIDYLLANAGTLFKYKYIKEFIKNIAVYPNGTEILLNNGKKAIVKEQNHGFPLRPIIKILTDENENSVDKVVDLLEQKNIVIKDTIL